MMARILTVLAVLVLLAGGGYFGFNYYSDYRLKAVLDQTITRLPPDYVASYQSAHFAILTGKGSVTGITVRHAAAPEFTVAIAELDIEHPNWSIDDSWAKAVADPASVKPDMALPVADKVELHGINIKGDKLDIADDSLVIAAPRLYPWSLTRPGVPTLAQAIKTMQHQPPDPADMLALLKFEAAYILSFGYDSYNVHDYHGTVVVPSTPATDSTPVVPEQKVSYRVAELGAGKFERGVCDSAFAAGINFDSGIVAHGSLDRAHFDHMNFRQPAMQLLKNAPLAPSLANGISIGSIGYEGFSIDVMGASTVSVGEVAISNIVFAQGVEKSALVSVKALKLARENIPTPEAQQVFDALDLKTMTISFSAGYGWDFQNKRINVHDTALKVDELGDLTLTASAANADPAGGWETNAALAHLLLRYTDASLAERLTKFGAKTMATDEAGIKQIAVKAVKDAAAKFPDSPRLQQAAEQVIVFVNTPRSLTVELKPDEPVPFLGLAAGAATPPPALAKQLGLGVRANTPH